MKKKGKRERTHHCTSACTVNTHSQRALNLNICAAAIVNEAHCRSIGINVFHKKKSAKFESERKKSGANVPISFVNIYFEFIKDSNENANTTHAQQNCVCQKMYER